MLLLLGLVAFLGRQTLSLLHILLLVIAFKATLLVTDHAGGPLLLQQGPQPQL